MTTHLGFRVDPSLRTEIDRRAELCDLTRSRYIVAVLSGQDPRPGRRQNTKLASRQLQRDFYNFSQIKKRWESEQRQWRGRAVFLQEAALSRELADLAKHIRKALEEIY